LFILNALYAVTQPDFFNFQAGQFGLGGRIFTGGDLFL
jgi:hypothetical protein